MRNQVHTNFTDRRQDAAEAKKKLLEKFKAAPKADDPEVVSSICAVLAETDVINMVSRGISASNILKGIHLSMAGRLAKLLRVIKVRDGVALATGGLALDEGLMAALNESMVKQKIAIEARSHPERGEQ